MTKLILGTLFFFSTLSAMADVPAIAPGSREEKVAILANNIFSVSKFKLAGLVYQVVVMDSELNGDTNTTTMVLVGEGEVGGEAGYQAAFQLSPNAKFRNLKTVVAVQNELKVVAYDLDSKETTHFYHFNKESNALIESARLFQPKRIVHSVGKAYTECLDPKEQTQKFKSRTVCVNSQDEFYYLAD